MPAVRDFALDPTTWDLAVVNGDFAVVADAAAAVQGAKIRVLTMLGEIWLDESLGVDYLGSIFIKNPNPAVVRALLTVAIAATPDVVNVSGAALVLNNDRTASIAFTMSTAYSASENIQALVTAPAGG